MFLEQEGLKKMARIRVGDVVRAHLDIRYKGKVLEIIRETPSTWAMEGPLDQEVFCIVLLESGKKVKTKITDLYVDYE